MRFQGLDLNLLVALDALLTERNLTTAASCMNLSQPAMSAALARLRDYFKDDLFVLKGRRLVPTALGQDLAQPTRETLLRIKAMLATRRNFDPAASSRRFRIVLSDFMTIVFFRRVIERARRIAPAVSFELLPFDDDPDETLRRGDTDFLIFPEIYLGDAFPKAPLFEEKLVCLACRSNLEVAEELGFSQYMAMGHVAAQFGKTRKPAIEEWLLLQYGLRRRIEIAASSFATIPHLVLGTNLIATVHARLARHFLPALPLRLLALPLPLPTFTEALQWSPANAVDPASVWMRELILDEARAEAGREMGSEISGK